METQEQKTEAQMPQMETKDFKRVANLTVDPKPLKEGIRNILRKKKTVILADAILHTRAAVGRMETDLQPYILGNQLNDEMRAKVKVDLGILLQHLTVAARQLKVKVPSSRRLVAAKGTPTFLLTEVSKLTNTMLEKYLETHTCTPGTKTRTKKVEGQPDTQETVNVLVPAELDFAAIASLVEQTLPLAYQLSSAFFHTPVAEVMAEHFERMKAAYPAIDFTAPPKKQGPKSGPPKKGAKKSETSEQAEKPSTAKA